MGALAALAIGLLWLALIGWIGRLQRQDGERRGWTRHIPPDLHLDLLAGGSLILAVVAFFWRTVSGDVYQPADGGDLVSFLFPTYRFAARELAQGTLPLWNPHLYGGAPFISDIQAGFLYPPNLLLFLLWPDFPYTTLQWLAMGHLAWAGLGMYVLLRTLRWPVRPVARLAAFFGALAFQFSDPLLTHLGNLNLIAVLSWLPWLLAAYDRALSTGRLRWLVVAAAAWTVGNYAGHAQSSLYLGLALTLYTAGRLALAAGERWPFHFANIGARWLTVVAMTGLFSAPIVLPALELSFYTERSAFAYQDTIAFSLAPAQLIGLLTPGFFGRGPALHWSLWDRVETPFAGVATLLLALGALGWASPEQRRRLWVWGGMGLFGLVAALGVYAIVHGWLTLLVPGLGQLRAPARFLILWTAALSVVAAVGVDALIRRGPALLHAPWGWRWRGLVGRGALVWLGVVLPLSYLALLLTQENETAFLRASVAALALTLAALFWMATGAAVAGVGWGWWSGPRAALLLVIVLFLDLSAAGAYTDISEQDPTVGFDHDAIVDFLRADPDLFRIDTLTDIQDLWQPDTAALVGLQDVGGIANPLMLDHWQAFREATGGRDTRRYDLLNVKYVIVRDGTPLPDGKFDLALDAPGDLAVYRNLDFWPRAWIVHQARLASDPANALAQFQAEDFDPTSTLILLDQRDVLDTAAPYGPLPDSPPQGSQAAITRYGNHTIAATTDAAAPGFLVLSEVWYPGWRATVNGDPAPVLRVDGALRGVPIPAGQATVELRFAPRGWRWGGWLALMALLWAAALLILDGRGLRGLDGRGQRRARPFATNSTDSR